MATHSNILARRTPWTVEPSWLQSMGMQRVRHDLATEATEQCMIRKTVKYLYRVQSK